jgi:serine protease inhibitor
MLDENELTSDIKLLSLNGAGFKGAWKGEPFLKNNTKEEDFKNADGKTSKIFFLSAEEKPFRLVKDDAEKLLSIEVPFTEHDDADGHKHKASLVILMPLEDNTVDKIIDTLDKDKLDKVLECIKCVIKKPETFKLPKVLTFEKGNR